MGNYFRKLICWSLNWWYKTNPGICENGRPLNTSVQCETTASFRVRVVQEEPEGNLQLIHLEILATESVLDFRNTIGKLFEEHVENVSLLFKGEELNDDETVISRVGPEGLIFYRNRRLEYD